MPNIPEGHVEIEITIDAKGNFRQEIVGHGAGSSCSNEDDQRLLRDLFEEMGEADDWGKTKECYEQERVRVNPTPQTPSHEEPSKQKKKMHMGFGV